MCATVRIAEDERLEYRPRVEPVGLVPDGAVYSVDALVPNCPRPPHFGVRTISLAGRTTAHCQRYRRQLAAQSRYPILAQRPKSSLARFNAIHAKPGHLEISRRRPVDLNRVIARI